MRDSLVHFFVYALVASGVLGVMALTTTMLMIPIALLKYCFGG